LKTVMVKLKMAHINVEGMVQGVGFRFFVERNALKLGLVGWVRNLYDGGVEIHSEGKETDVDRFVEIVRVGPSSAKLNNISLETEEIKKLSYKDFRILQTGY